jgi:hypothetical protein
MSSFGASAAKTFPRYKHAASQNPASGGIFFMAAGIDFARFFHFPEKITT